MNTPEDNKATIPQQLTGRISPDIAEKEINAWLDSHKIGSKKRIQLADSIETLVYAIVDGDVIVNTDGHLVQKLKFPVQDDKGNTVLSELVYKNRPQMSEISDRQNGVKATGVSAVLLPYISAITGIASGLINKLKAGDDVNVAQAVAGFFI